MKKQTYFQKRAFSRTPGVNFERPHVENQKPQKQHEPKNAPKILQFHGG